MIPERPHIITECEWNNLQKAISIITEHFPNLAVFINWVDDEGETQHTHILQGNKFAIQNHVGKWVDGDFDLNDDDEKEFC